MPSRLEAIEGPAKGEIITLQDDPVTIGRDPSNGIPILDSLLSRQHCRIWKESGIHRLRDLDSRNGTLVNSTPVKECSLKAGDQIRVGKTIFLFVSDEATGVGQTELEFDEDAASTTSTVVLRKEESVYLKPPGEAGASTDDRVARDFSALLHASGVLSEARGIEAVQQKVLDAVLKVVPADRAAILIAGQGLEEFDSALGWDRRRGKVEKVEVSRTIVRRVLKDNVGILSNEVPSTDVFRSAESLLVPKVHSVLAVPLEAFERVHGVIYVDASAPDASFDEGHLHVLTAIARIAATALENARQWESLEGENRRLRDEISGEYNMVGESPAIEEVYRFIHRVADKDSTVLIWGESGTGKELVARAIHRNSDRALKPFIAINCAALPEALLESELFGHEKGSFTGAVGQKLGKLEVAEGGTVFLDEIGELAPMLQAKLLRVLQEREFERVGGTRPIKLNIRLIAATNRDLKKASISGAYRQDLYYRLNVVSVRMPALRERREDIPLLAAFFAQKHGAKAKRPVSGISPGARYALMDYDWPGNVRELENAIERAVVMGSSDVILPEDLPEAILERGQLDSSAATGGFHEGVLEAKKQLILKALDKSSGNYNEAAQLLGVHPNYLHRLITNLNLRARKQRGQG